MFRDPAKPDTPVARSAADVQRLATATPAMADLDARVSVCRACPRLVSWREQVATIKRRSFEGEQYWGRPVPGFGSEHPRVLILGLAPAAHGANRTGRNFTGDRSGDWLYASLYRTGLANPPTSASADDGLTLIGTRGIASGRCAPPENRPTTEEPDTCRSWLVRELELCWPTVRAVVVLGGFGWASLWPALRAAGIDVPKRIPAFSHGAEVLLPDGRAVLASYHVSQQNTFTGRLTEPMLDAVFARAAQHAELP